MTPTEREYIWVGAHIVMAAWAVFEALLFVATGDPVAVAVSLAVGFVNGWAAKYTLRRVRRLVRGTD